MSILRSTLELPTRWRLQNLAAAPEDVRGLADTIQITLWSRTTDAGALHGRSGCQVNRSGSSVTLERSYLQLAEAAAAERPLCGCLTARDDLVGNALTLHVLAGSEPAPDVVIVPWLARHATVDAALQPSVDAAVAELRRTFDDGRWSEMSAAVREFRMYDSGLVERDLPGVSADALELASFGMSEPETLELVGNRPGGLLQEDVAALTRVYTTLRDTALPLTGTVDPYDPEDGQVWAVLEVPSRIALNFVGEDPVDWTATVLAAVAAETVEIANDPRGVFVQLPASAVSRMRGPDWVADGDVAKATIEVAAAVYSPDVHDWHGAAVLDAQLLGQLADSAEVVTSR